MITRDIVPPQSIFHIKQNPHPLVLLWASTGRLPCDCASQARQEKITINKECHRKQSNKSMMLQLNKIKLPLQMSKITDTKIKIYLWKFSTLVWSKHQLQWVLPDHRQSRTALHRAAGGMKLHSRWKYKTNPVLHWFKWDALFNPQI